MHGRVIKSTGSWYDVMDENKKVYKCRLRGVFKVKGMTLRVTNPIAVGDRVEFVKEKNEEGTCVITDIQERDNYIIRKSTRKKKHAHIIAANIDQAVLIVTLVRPRTSLGFIDRFLVSAESYRIPAAVVFNKADLLDEEAKGYARELMDMYEDLGYKTLLISALDEHGIENFLHLLEGKTSLLSGHSGVGKSTLVNKIIPDIEQKTAEISSFANKGKHTTTFAEMFEVKDQVSEDTFIIDTPGIKELGLMEIEEEELHHYFPEFRDLFGHCRFYNCTHTHEPGCAILDAVRSGRIYPSRYESYLSMLNEEETHR
jgi:ribosome biogenesis GTPase / thiamine phosphate phosphatase